MRKAASIKTRIAELEMHYISLENAKDVLADQLLKDRTAKTLRAYNEIFSKYVKAYELFSENVTHAIERGYEIF